jgi:hypothetical protein
MISILREVIHAFLSIVLHDYYEKIDQTDLSFFYEIIPERNIIVER